MDPELWGNLQHHIGLENVYSKLPLREFFRLRAVCKDWDGLARRRRCLADPIQRPYFVIAYPVTLPFIPYHTGVLTFHIASGRWKWNRLPFESNQINPLCQPFSVKGLLLSFCSGPEGFQVYNVHTKKCLGPRIYLPPATLSFQTPTGEIESPCTGTIESYRALGMAVDTSVTPHTFKVILGGLNTRTKIYDSATYKWTEMRSFAVLTAPSKRWTIKSCLHCGGNVYIWSQMRTILVYSLVEDSWSTLDPPPQQHQHENDAVAGALGCWDERVFVVTPDGRRSLAVWELQEGRAAWSRFESIPGEMYASLVGEDAATKVFANFCNELVLVYTVLGKNVNRTGVGEKVVLFNLATKMWEMNNAMDWSAAVVPLAYDWPQPRRRMELWNAALRDRRARIARGQAVPMPHVNDLDDGGQAAPGPHIINLGDED